MYSSDYWCNWFLWIFICGTKKVSQSILFFARSLSWFSLNIFIIGNTYLRVFFSWKIKGTSTEFKYRMAKEKQDLRVLYQNSYCLLFVFIIIPLYTQKNIEPIHSLKTKHTCCFLYIFVCMYLCVYVFVCVAHKLHAIYP